jgi:hypothetical protein
MFLKIFCCAIVLFGNATSSSSSSNSGAPHS